MLPHTPRKGAGPAQRHAQTPTGLTRAMTVARQQLAPVRGPARGRSRWGRRVRPHPDDAIGPARYVRVVCDEQEAEPSRLAKLFEKLEHPGLPSSPTKHGWDVDPGTRPVRLPRPG